MSKGVKLEALKELFLSPQELRIYRHSSEEGSVVINPSSSRKVMTK